jgi:hypothetical protein
LVVGSFCNRRYQNNDLDGLIPAQRSLSRIEVPVFSQPANHIDVLRTYPSVAAAAQVSTVEVDVRYTLTEVCSATPGDCFIHIEATQGVEMVSSAPLQVWARTTSVETMSIVLSAAFVPGVIDLRVTAVKGDLVIYQHNTTLPVRAAIDAGATPCAGTQKKKNVLYLMVDDLGTQVGACVAPARLCRLWLLLLSSIVIM